LASYIDLKLYKWKAVKQKRSFIGFFREQEDSRHQKIPLFPEFDEARDDGVAVDFHFKRDDHNLIHYRLIKIAKIVTAF